METSSNDNVTPEQHARELALEKGMVDRGRERYFKTVARCQEQGLESSTSYAKIMMKRGIEPLSLAIQAFLSEARSGTAGRRHKAVAALEGMDTDVVAFITLRKVMDTFSKKVLLQTVSIGVGREIELEQKLAALESQDKDRYKMTQNHIKTSKNRRHRRTVLHFAFGKSEDAGTTEYDGMPDQELFHIGQKLIELAVSATGLFEINMAPYKRVAKGLEAAAYFLEPTTACREWLCTHTEEVSVMAPDFVPTIIPPKPWAGAYGGGYYSALVKPLALVKTRNRHYLTALNERLRNGEMQEVLNAVNALQDTVWAVNQDVLAVLSHLWENTEGDVAGLPLRDGHRLPLCPVCGADLTDSTAARVRHACLDTLPEDVFKAWKKQAAMVRERNVSTFSQRLQIAKILSIAERYKDEPAFYFPYQLDFRGRIYAVPSYLTPQGTDFAKGVLCFGASKALGSMAAVKWLAIHGANTFGNDKVSLDERYSWVLENQDRILLAAADPLSETWWMDTDSPWCFLAFCFEWAGYVREGLAFKSRLPIAMDGTCNGLQIFSLLLRDKVGGEAVNLTPSERPNDIYRIVADKVIERLKEDAQDAKLNHMVMTKDKETPKALYNPYTCANILKTAGIDRKTTKRQVMVLPYGGTETSCREYTEAWLKDKIQDGRINLPEGQKVYGMSMYLGKLIWEAIGTTVIAARDAMGFLQDMATVVNRVNKPIQWTTPCGLPVLQEYKDTKEHRIDTRIGDKIVKFAISKQLDTLNSAKQRSAISPNYVHSLDAAALMKTVNNCLMENVNTFAMIHDSYGTHAADSEKLAALLRDTFIQMFGGTEHRLADFQKEVLACIPLEDQKKLPALPNIGELDIAEVQKSVFFFA